MSLFNDVISKHKYKSFVSWSNCSNHQVTLSLHFNLRAGEIESLRNNHGRQRQRQHHKSVISLVEWGKTGVVQVPNWRNLLTYLPNTTSFPGSTPLLRWRLREDPGTHRYDTHVDWCEDIDILTLVLIGRNCLPCKMTDLCSCICYLQLKRNYRLLNIPRVLSTIYGN